MIFIPELPRIAHNGLHGYGLLFEKLPDIVIVDLNMPVMDGYEFIEKTVKKFPSLPVIIISGVGKVSDAIKAIQAGAWDFISKPIADMNIILHTIEKCREKVKLIDENKRYHNNLEELVAVRTRQLELVKRQVVTCLGKASEFKDTETGYHVQRVGEMSFLLAEKLGLDISLCKLIRDAATMHDVGKIGIPDVVLLKKGKLDPDEWEIMKEHSFLGCKILSSHNENLANEICTPEFLLKDNTEDDLLLVAKKIALFHHERWDGSGYPYNLKGDSIPIEARIVAITDVYDALSSARPYKKLYEEVVCLEIIKEGKGTQFDPEIVDLFFDNIDFIHAIKKRLSDNEELVL